MQDRRLISVRTEVVLDVLVERMHEECLRREPADPAPAEARLERLGALARELERERFAPATAPIPWLAERVATAGGDAAAVAAELAAREPEWRPEPDDADAASWRIPGPGGHVRHFVAVRAAQAVGADLPEAKRAWLRGFFAACCAEAARDGAASG